MHSKRHRPFVASKRRHSGNRLNFLFATSVLSALVMFFFVIRFDFIAFAILFLSMVILKPLQRVSAHVIDLETMETLGLPGRDFFPTMIFRDVALGFWRGLSLALFAGVIFMVGVDGLAVRFGFVLLAGATLLTYFGAWLLYRKR
ncbi:MAG: hypothetical protein AAB869_04455 [Patescibacteria group bacterium]